MDVRAELVVEDEYSFVFTLDEGFESVVEGKRAVPDFLEHSLEQDDRRSEERGFD